jgi:hypothetical protein
LSLCCPCSADDDAAGDAGDAVAGGDRNDSRKLRTSAAAIWIETSPPSAAADVAVVADAASSYYLHSYYCPLLSIGCLRRAKVVEYSFAAAVGVAFVAVADAIVINCHLNFQKICFKN